MAPKNNHSRILLSKNSAGAIAYCETCDVVELEIGAISMRVEASSLEALSDLIGYADKCLSIYKHEKAELTQKVQTEYSFH